jgi:hypothetical protein
MNINKLSEIYFSKERWNNNINIRNKFYLLGYFIRNDKKYQFIYPATLNLLKKFLKKIDPQLKNFSLYEKK